MCGLFIDSLSLIVNSLFSAVCTVLDYRESDEESVVDPPTLTIVSASLPLHTSHSSPHTVRVVLVYSTVVNVPFSLCSFMVIPVCSLIRLASLNGS